MLKSENQANIFSMGTEKLTKSLKQAGYNTIFDIASESFSEFKESNPEIKPSDAKEIYKMAIQRRENLHMLFNSFKLRNDPVIKNIKKLSSSGKEKETYELLKNSLDGGEDFQDLFPERSESGYAEVTSIQSLFSPGRYLTLLYKVARNLHDENSYLHIDKRRPDLQNIVLSNDNMNKEVSSLDILLDILEGNGSNEDIMDSLKEKYYPMTTLPYDDDITQIREVLKSNSLELTKIENTMLDRQREYFLKNDYVRLLPKDDAYVRDGSNAKNNYGSESNLVVKIDDDMGYTRETYLKFQLPSLYRPIKKAIITLVVLISYPENNVINKALIINDDNWSESEITWNNKPNLGNIITSWEVPASGEKVNIDVTKEVNEAVKNGKQYISIAIQAASDYGIDGDTTYASKEHDSEGVRPSIEIYEKEILFTNEILSLTPHSYNLITNSNLKDEDIANHYNITDILDTSGNNSWLVNPLNNVNKFCKKSGLSFNKLVELTMQDDCEVINADYKSRFIKFGDNKNVPVSEYGAFYLNQQSQYPLLVNHYPIKNEDNKIKYIKIAPKDDAYVRNGSYKDNNYGFEGNLVVKNDDNNGFTREAYIKFDLSSFTRPILNASIFLTCVSLGTSGIKNQAKIIEDDNWKESEITWNNKPTSGEDIATWSVSEIREAVEIDITSAVNNAILNDKEQISICILADKYYGQNGDITYASKEHSINKYRPFMVIKDSIKIDADADVWVRGGYNYNDSGNTISLEVNMDAKEAFVTQSYIRFNLSMISKPLESAIINLTPIYRRTSGILNEAKLVDDNNWDEYKIGWSNRLTIGDTIASFSVPEEGTYAKIDVTKQVNDAISNHKEYLTIAITANEDYDHDGDDIKDSDVQYASREHENKQYRPFMEISLKDTDLYSLNFNEYNVVDTAGKAEKLIRLSNKTGLTFEQLDWLIANLNKLKDTEQTLKTFDILPEDDTWISTSSPDMNYGKRSELELDYLDESFLSQPWIKFDISNYKKAVKEAKVSLKILLDSSSIYRETRIMLKSVDSNWDELTLTWNTKPIIGETFSELTIQEEQEYVEIDVTEQVNNAIQNGKDKFAFIIDTKDSPGLIRFASKEHEEINLRPSMIITTNIVDINDGVLQGIATFKLLNKRYGITSDEFVTFVGEVNTYAEKGKKSFYETIFTSADGKTTIPLGSTLQFEIDKQGLYESICCRAMKVTPDEFYRIGKYCFGDNTKQIIADEKTLAQLYRMGKIPSMLGSTFSEVEILWKIISYEDDKIILDISNNYYSLRSLDIILRTEAIFHWMSIHNIDVLSLYAMTANEYSITATAELYNFLSKVYKSINDIDVNVEDSIDISKLSRAFAAQFNIKPNIIGIVIKWIRSCKDFNEKKFIAKVKSYFKSNTKDELTELEKYDDLIKWCHQISQFAMVVKFFGLTEQDLKLIVEQPKRVISNQDTAPELSLYLLLLLSRFKEWQQRLKVSNDEAMRYFDKITLDTITQEDARKYIAKIHGYNENEINTLCNYLFKENGYPKNFEDIFKLESLVNLSGQLKIGSKTIDELYRLINESDVLKLDNLISSISRSMMATIE